MDNVERVGGSSSPNGNRIVRVEGGAAGRCTVHLQDGSSFFAPLPMIARYGLVEGEVLSGDQRDALEQASELVIAEGKALDLLARHDHSEAQLSAKLLKRGFSAGVAREVCASLNEQGYLDDRRFARLWIESRIRKRNEGIPRLLAGLARAGVPRQVATDALYESLPDDYEENAFASAVDELEGSRGKDASGIARRLAALGFSSERIGRYVEAARERRRGDEDLYPDD